MPEFIQQLESNSGLRLSEHEGQRPGLSRMLSTQERAGAEEIELVINRYPTQAHVQQLPIEAIRQSLSVP